MSQQLLNYQSTLKQFPLVRVSRTKFAVAVVCAVLLVLNVILIWIAALDRSWTAFGIAIMIGPISNGVVLVVSLLCTPIVIRLSGGAATPQYVLAAIGLPILATAADFFIIYKLGGHGC